MTRTRTARPQLSRFFSCSPIHTIRANFYLSLQLLGWDDGRINRAYAAALPAAGERALIDSLHTVKVCYLPFAGFLLGRYNPYDYNIRGTIREYGEHYGLDLTMRSYRTISAYLLEKYHRGGPFGGDEIDLASWGREFWKTHS